MFYCFICASSFITIPLLRHHVYKHDLSNIKEFQCKQEGCYKKYESVSLLFKHLKTKVHKTTQRKQDIHESNFTPSSSNNYQKSYFPEEVVEGDQNIDKFSLDLEYLLSLYSHSNFNRKDILRIVDKTSIWAEKRFGESSFNDLDTEYKIVKTLNSMNLWIEPKTLNFDYVETVSKKHHGLRPKMKAVSCAIIPLKETLTKVFSNSNLLTLARTYMCEKNNDNGVLSDARDGKICEELGPNVFPFVIFFDEMESGNALGSHKGDHKIGMLYISMRCFPPLMYSKLSNVYLYAAIPSNCNEFECLDQLLSSLTDEINDLEVNGILIEEINYKFKFLGIVGDNLGQHQLLGFSGSFSANFPCRACYAPLPSCMTMCNENKLLLRNPLNYERDLAINDLSRTGVKNSCALNNLHKYHVTTHTIYDIMHDLLEGVLNYGVSALLNKLIKDNLFTLKQLNDRIYAFNFMHVTNKPPYILQRNLDKNGLSFSAAELMNFTLYLSVIMGDLVDLDNPVWEYYLILRKILDILLLKKIWTGLVAYLDSLISEHHTLYISLFNKCLTPKFHHMLHYSTALLAFGPLCHNWAMRFEGKNYETKLYTNSICSRVNLCASIARRYMFSFSHHLLQLSKDFESKSSATFGPVVDCEDVEKCFKWLSIDGLKYDRGCIVQLINKTSDIFPVFACIQYISSINTEPVLVLNEYASTTYSEHYASYEVGKLSDSFCCVKLSAVSKPLVYTLNLDKIFVCDTGLC